MLRRERERGVCVGCDDSVFIIHILEAITLYHHLSVHSFFVFSKGNPPPGACVKKNFSSQLPPLSILSSQIPTVQPPPPLYVVSFSRRPCCNQ